MFFSSFPWRISLSFLINWKSFCSNLMAFSFQNLSVWTELHSSTSLLISLWYLSKLLRTLILFYRTVPVFLICSKSSSFLMLPFNKVSMILRSLASIRSSKHFSLLSTFLKIMKETLVNFSLDNFWRISHTLFSTPYLGTSRNFVTATSTKESSQMLRRM